MAFPKNVMSDPGPGEGYSTTSNSRHFMAMSLLKMRQIFMLAFSRLRVEGEVAQVLVVSQPPPLAFLPGVLECSFDRLPETTLGTGRTGSPCDVPLRYASEPIPRCRGTVARWHGHLRGLATAIHKISRLAHGR
jgi:hypothetical protein